jgi:uncharacterized protein YceK
MRHILLVVLAGLVLAGCGTSATGAGTAPDHQATLHRWAQTVMQGDLAAAKPLMDTPSVDWEDRTINAQKNGAFTGYHLAGDWTTTDAGQQARVVWERGELDEYIRYICITVVVTPAGKIRVTENPALCTTDGSTDVVK